MAPKTSKKLQKQKEIRELETKVCSGGAEGAVNLSNLLVYLTDENVQVKSVAIHALRRSFVHLLNQGDMDAFQTAKNKAATAELEKYASWLRAKYQQFCAELLSQIEKSVRSSTVQSDGDRSKDGSDSSSSEEENVERTEEEVEFSRFQVACFRTLMTLVSLDARSRIERTEKAIKQNAFGVELFSKLVFSLVRCGEQLSTFVRILHDEYVTYADVRYYLLQALRTIAAARVTVEANELSSNKNEEMSSSGSESETEGKKRKKNTSTGRSKRQRKEAETSKLSLDTKWVKDVDARRLCANVFDLIVIVPAPNDDADFSNMFAQSMKSGSTSKASSQKHQQRAFEKAWLELLRIRELPRALFRRVLLILPDHVIPNMLHPLLLADFLAHAYDEGRKQRGMGDSGALSLMALRSLFKLITEYDLEYPRFFPCLYQLLDNFVFHARYRSDFFELLEVCLTSTHLPSYLVAAFAKKLLRLTLHAPPAAAVYVVPFVHNLIRRHPNCVGLIHRTVGTHNTDTDGGLVVDQTADPNDRIIDRKERLRKIREQSALLAKQGRKEIGADSGDQTNNTTNDKKSEKQIDIKLIEKDVIGVDPFDIHQDDPAECKALDSSLWELTVLEKHYCPTVSGLASRMFKEPVTELDFKGSTRPKPPIDLEPFQATSYKTLFDTELKVRRAKDTKIRHVPFVFQKPESLGIGEGLFAL